MNIILTYSCSNTCKYCFAAKERGNSAGSNLSLENATRLAKWAASARVKSIALAGGEPFLHPDINRIISIFIDECASIPISIFTGGVYPEEKLNSLPRGMSVMLNINEPRDYSSATTFEGVFRHGVRCLVLGVPLTIGFNIWRHDFDPSFMPRLAHGLGLSSFRWSIANPVWGTDTEVLRPNSYKEVSRRCMDMLNKAAQYNVRAHLDCPLPICFFNADELGWLTVYHPDTASRLGTCSPPIDVGPDLQAFRCFPLASLGRVPITNFHSEDELAAWFVREIDERFSRPETYEACKECEHSKAKRCQGGCFAWRYSSAALSERSHQIIPLAETLFTMLQHNDYSGALAMYEGSAPATRTALGAYLAATAAFNTGLTAKALRYGTLAASSGKGKLGARAFHLLKRIEASIGSSDVLGGNL